MATNEPTLSRPGPAPGRWRFAGMELDETGGRLVVNGVPHVLDHGSYGVLVALLRQAGTVVGKDALLQAGWPGRVVSENSLTKAIGRLRHLLEDPEAELLCTAHGYGYRLAARAEWLPADAVGATPPAPSTAASQRVEAPVPTSSPPPGRTLALPLSVLLLLVAAVALWLWQREAAPAQSVDGGGTAAAVPNERSIAVLPFIDLSQARDQRYFTDGLTDELLDRLAKLPQLHVASRTSAFAFQDSKDTVTEIGRKLGVATVLEGSVRRDGDKVRITVQLIKVSDGFHLWSETYDKRMTDLFAVQDDISRSVVQALKVQLLPGQEDAVARHNTNSLAAYDEYMTGRRFYYLGGPDNERRAIASYERAIALDPEFSSAMFSLAVSLGGDADYADSPEQVAAGKKRSLQLMNRAIELEPDRANFYLLRADFLYSTQHDWRGGQRDLDTAARLLRQRPSELLMRQCRLYAAIGRLDEAIAAEREALKGDPNSTWAWSLLGFHLSVVGKYAEAQQAIAMATRVRPDDNHVAYYEGLNWLLQGKSKEAIAAFERSGSVFRLAGLAAAHFEAGDDAASRQALKTLETKYAPIGAYQVAQAHAWRGEKDEAFAWLEHAAQQQDAGLVYLKFDPMLRKLHGDPRYQQWLQRMGLDEASLAREMPRTGR